MFDALIPVAIIDARAFLDWFVNNASYILIFAFMVVESSFIPFPSEVIVPPAAFVASQKYFNNVVAGAGTDLNIFVIVIVATAGALCGALVNYYLSVWIGRPIVYRFANSRFGHACLIDQAKVEKAERYFDKYGSASTFIGRLIPAVRQLISIPAGLARMNIVKFIIFTTLGAFVWNAVLAGLGYWLAAHVSLGALYENVEKYNAYLSWGGVALLILCVAYITWNAFKPTKDKQSN